MSEKLRRSPPYSDTKVPWSRTKSQIDQMLEDFNVDGVQWTSYRGDAVLRFIVSVELKGVRREITFEVKPPVILVKKRSRGRRGPLVKTRDKNQEYRLLYWWLKSKLESVLFGLSTVEKEFLSQVLIPLPHGNGVVTIGEVLTKAIELDRLNALPYLDSEGK